MHHCGVFELPLVYTTVLSILAWWSEADGTLSASSGWLVWSCRWLWVCVCARACVYGVCARTRACVRACVRVCSGVDGSINVPILSK